MHRSAIRLRILAERLLGRDRQHAPFGQSLGDHPHRSPVRVEEGSARADRLDAGPLRREHQVVQLALGRR